MKKRYLLAVAILIIMLLMVPLKIIPSVFAPTVEYYTSSSDGYLMYTDEDYNTAWTATSAETKDDTGIKIWCSNTKSGSIFYIRRIFFFFDTSAIPDNATINEAKLGIYTESTSSGANATVQNGQPTYPRDPLVVGDYDKSLYSGNGGSKEGGWASYSYNEITLNEDGMSWISLTGTTKLCVRAGGDIDGTEPPDIGDYFHFHSSEYGGGIHAAYLKITYTAGGAPIHSNDATNSTLANSLMLHSVLWTDEDLYISHIRSGTNNTGSWVWGSWVDYGNDSSTEWGNFTFTLTKTIGIMVQFQQQCNDSEGNIGASTLLNVTTTGLTLTISFNYLHGEFFVNDTSRDSGWSKACYYDEPVECSGRAAGGYVFSNFTWNTGNSMVNPYVLNIQGNWTVNLYFEDAPSGGELAILFVLIPAGFIVLMAILARKK